jgi:serine/threonine-protein kinase
MSHHPTLPPGLANRLNPVCDRFEDLWLAGQRPRLEEYLPLVEPADQSALLRELLALEMHYRSHLGERVTAEEYRNRLPGHASLVEEVFGPSTTGPEDPWPTPLGPTSTQDHSQLAKRGRTSGLRVGRYEVQTLIARGGMAEVWRACDLDLNRPLALKVLQERLRDQVELERRFREEAQITGQLQHPGIPPVHEVGTLPDGRPFLAMKLIEGHTFADLLAERATPADDLPRFLEIFEAVCQTMAYAHSRGVIHRDLKPGNIMVGAFGEVQVMDWGLAKVRSVFGRGSENRADAARFSEPRLNEEGELDREPAHTVAGAILGTPAFMAPEQARGEVEQLDERCDVFGLGAILCVTLTGQPPYRGSSDAVQIRAERGELDEALVRLAACGADEELLDLTRRCLAARKEDRPCDAQEVAAALGAYLAGAQQRLHEAQRKQAAAEARAEEAVKKAAAERRARRLLLGLAAAVLGLLLAGGVAGWVVQQQRARQAFSEHESRAAAQQARDLLDEGWKTHDQAKLELALIEAGHAVTLARSGNAGANVLDQALVLHAGAQDQLARVKKNNKLRDAVLNLALPLENHRYEPRADVSGLMMAIALPTLDDQYAAAFRTWGVDVNRTPEAEVVKQLRAELEPVLADIVAALDAWMLARRTLRESARDWRRLLRIARQLDPSGRRGELRALLSGQGLLRPRNVAGLVGVAQPWLVLGELERARQELLQDIRGKVIPEREPVLSLVLFAQVCSTFGDHRRAEDILRRAATARPDELVLLDALGKLLHGQERFGEAIECFRAIRARRRHLGIALSQALGDAGRLGEGETVLRDLLGQQPGNPELHFHLGFNLREQKKRVEAVAAYRQAIRLRPDFHQAHHNLGGVLAEQQKLDEALAAFRQAIRLRADYHEAHNMLGYALARLKKLDQAANAFSRAITLRPDFHLAHFNLGTVLAEQKKLDEAVAAYRRAIKVRPDLHIAHNNLGVALREQKKLDEAVAAYRRAITLRPDFTEGHYNLGVALREQKKLDEAVAAFRWAIQLNPDLHLAYNGLGLALVELRKLDEAVAAYQKAIALRPDFPDGHFHLGIALGMQKKLDEAVAAYQKAIKLRPDLHLAHNNLGTVLGEQKKLDEAVAAFRQAIKVRADFHLAHNNLGNILRVQKKWDEAMTAYRQAIKVRPDFHIAHNNLGHVLRHLNRLEEAVAAYRQTIRLRPDFAEGHYNLGVVLAQQNNGDEAITAFRQAIHLRPDFHEAYSNLGGLLAAQKKLDEAVAAFRRAINLRPGYGLGHLNLGVALMQQAHFRESLAALKTGHDLLAAQDPRRQQAQQLIQSCQRFLALDARLPAVLKGTDQPAAAEQIDFAVLCLLKKHNAAAARFFAAAFKAQPRLALTKPGHLYDAACAAALAGTGQGKDAAGLDGPARAELRYSALCWLQENLRGFARLPSAMQRSHYAQVRQTLLSWQKDADLAAVRERDALARLPEAEQVAWLNLWAQVETLLARAQQVTKPASATEK